MNGPFVPLQVVNKEAFLAKQIKLSLWQETRGSSP